MSPPLAFLNDEERHWLTDLGLPNQRRWLNHRNSVTNTAVAIPPPTRIVTQCREIQITPSFFSVSLRNPLSIETCYAGSFGRGSGALLAVPEFLFSDDIF